jgi:phosphoserine phosphatase
MPFDVLSRRTSIHRQKLERLERIRHKRDFDDPEVFQNCSVEDIGKIEKALQCPRDLKSGKDNDFSTEYIAYYKEYKLNPQRGAQQVDGLSFFEHKAVVFDFDGTLTLKVDDHFGRTTWERMWIELGYDIRLCSKYFTQYLKGEIGHQEWCDITADYFKRRGFCKQHLVGLAKGIILVPGLQETLERLATDGLKLYIASGSIFQLIELILGKSIKHFSDIQANTMTFDKQGMLLNIIGTKYDFEGKATYIELIAKENHFSTANMIYIGNSINDVSAYKSGADTLCVNPHFTDPTNKTQWKDNIPNMSNLAEIMDYINIQGKKPASRRKAQ